MTSNRLAENIRRIIKEQRGFKGLDTANTRTQLYGKRGIGYVSNQNALGGTNGSPNNQTPAQDVQEADPKTGELRNQDQIGGDNGGNTNADPNTGNNAGGGVKTDTTGVHDTEGLIDGTEGPKIVDPLSYDGELALNPLATTLNGITGLTDCASGEDLSIRFDGVNMPLAATVDENGDTLQNAWESLDATGEYLAPEVANFQVDYYWEMAGSGNPTAEQASTPYEAAKLAQTYLNANPPGGRFGPFAIEALTPDASVPPALYTVKYQDQAVPGPSGEFTLSCSRISCSSFPPDDSGSCPLTAPSETSYSIDHPTILRYDAGHFTTSIYAPNAPVKLAHQEKSKIDFCFGTGRFGSVEATADGGFMIYETATAGATPNGIVRVYNKDKQLIAATDSTGYTAYRP